MPIGDSFIIDLKWEFNNSIDLNQFLREEADNLIDWLVLN